MKRICLITHCKATHAAEKKVGGWYDSNLTNEGRKQAEALRAKIESFDFELHKVGAYSSDLSRAAQTANIIFQNTDTKIIFDSRLREMCFGEDGGKDVAEHIKTMQPTPKEGNRLDHRICQGAESRREFAKRIVSVVDEITSVEDDAIIVTHGFAATFVIAAFQKIDIESMGFVSYKLASGSISVLTEDELFENRTLAVLNH